MVFSPLNDSRMFTDYRSSCSIDKDMKNSNNITNNFDYRQYLQANAENIMNQSFTQTQNNLKF